MLNTTTTTGNVSGMTGGGMSGGSSDSNLQGNAFPSPGVPPPPEPRPPYVNLPLHELAKIESLNMGVKEKEAVLLDRSKLVTREVGGALVQALEPGATF